MHRAIYNIAAYYLKGCFMLLLVVVSPINALSTTIVTTTTGSFAREALTPPMPLPSYQIDRDTHPQDETDHVQAETNPWTFNVTLDPDFEQLLDSDSLKSAVLALTLKPEPGNDDAAVVIQDLSDNDAPEHRSLSAQSTTTIEVELLNVYSGKDLLEFFKNHAGKLPISYRHPEKISAIQLRLTTENPDNRTLVLGGGLLFILCLAGGFGYVGWRRKKRRRASLQDDRLATIGQLTSSVIHDVKNSFTAIRSCAEVMAEDGLEPDERKDFAQMIVHEIERGVDMTQEVLEYSRGSTRTLTLQPISLRVLLQDILLVIAPNFIAQQVTIKTDFQGTGEIMADVEKIQRVCMNLIGNARDAMPDGGTLTIGTRFVHDRYRLEFIDTGCGMSSELQARVFEPFFTEGKPKGTGLGMAIVKDILDAHQARIEIDSAINQGTTIRILFPRHHAVSHIGITATPTVE